MAEPAHRSIESGVRLKVQEIVKRQKSRLIAMSSNVTLDQVEQLAMQLTATEQLKLLAHLSEHLSRLELAALRSDVEPTPRGREAMADALLQELDRIVENIEG
jgi:hypothetical protein